MDALPFSAETPVECRGKRTVEDCELIKFCRLYVSTRTFEK